MEKILKIAESCAHVTARPEHVFISEKALDGIAERMALDKTAPPPWDRELHFYDGSGKTLMYVLVLDALNFCFFPDPGAPRWKVPWRDRWLDGYWALAAALTCAFLKGIPLWDPLFLSTLSEEALREVLGGTAEIPLFRERLQNLREAGSALITHFDGSFAALVESAGHDALALAGEVARHFPSFNDEALYRGEKVYFFKRAQILVSDLAGTFSGREWGFFHNLERLTAFADYKIPQVLRSLGILSYSAPLASKVDTRIFLPAGSPEEVEIRAATVTAVERLKERLNEKGRPLSACEIDWILWQKGQEGSRLPYHLTRTIYY
ncbi:MAG: queuosine salvage family protein [Candidatus Eremiobacteraeota bacterium]|nr:queuosine salvage family protein [Candidatus Eremiobacteraeota bacterium]